MDTNGQKQLVFFHLPVFLTLLINFVGFIFTLRILLKSNNENRIRSKSVGVSNSKKSVADMCPSFFTNLDLDENLKNDLVKFYNHSHTLLPLSFKSILIILGSVYKAVSGPGYSMDIWEYPTLCWSWFSSMWVFNQNIFQDNWIALLHQRYLYLHHIRL